MRRLYKHFFSRPEISAVIILLALMIGFHAYSGKFFTVDNFRVILGILPELGMVALGATMLMIAGEFDLSVGSTFALAPMVMALLAKAGLSSWTGIMLALLTSLAVGFINGFITLRFAIPSFVATLGTLFAVRSLTVVLSGGFPPPFPTDAPTAVFSDPLGGGFLRMSVFWLLGFLILAFILLTQTNFGNWVYATGGDEASASNMGINTKQVKMVCFMMCSFLAGFAGIIQVMRLKSPLPSLGVGLELDAIAAAVIGGSALTGGIGSVFGALVGAALIRVIDNGLVISRFDANWFKFAIGALTILAVIFNSYLRKSALKVKVK